MHFIQAENLDRLLPSRSLNLGQVSQMMDGRIRFAGKRVQTPRLPLDDVAFTVEIGDRKIRVDPLEFGVGGGEIRTTVQINTNTAPFRGEI